MGIRDLQVFLDSNNVPGASVPIDLLKYVRSLSQRPRNRVVKGQLQQPPSMAKMRLVVDAECCLDRLYGGYFSDWACGGQWNRMMQFLLVLMNATEMAGLELAVFFNGCLESSRRAEWIQNQLETRDKVNCVLKHVTTKGTPPPKVWWTPPACLRTSLRMALRHLNVTVICSMDDHRQEVIGYCRENGFDGLMADDAEYVVFYPPKYFSSQQMKLTYKGSLDTKEYVIPELLKSLDITPEKFCILAALLGNYILPENDLTDFYKKLNINTIPNRNIEQLIKALASFVKELPSTKEDVVAMKIFGSLNDPRCAKLRQSIQYYVNGTKEGFLHYKPLKQMKDLTLDSKSGTQSNSSEIPSAADEDLDMTRFATDTIESEQESLNAYKQATANATNAPPQIVIEPPIISSQGNIDNSRVDEEPRFEGENTHVNGSHNLLISSSSSSSSSSVASPRHVTANDAMKNIEGANIRKVLPEVVRTASERHQKGLMSHYIYQILTSGEIKLPVLMEDEMHREFPSIHLIYRPIRQMVYAILFNLHHHVFMAKQGIDKGETEKVDVPDVFIKEWVWSKPNPFHSPDVVKAEHIGWAVPTVQRLWFGSGVDDKRRRLRGFLTCLKSDSQLMLNTSYMPQHLLVMGCVLRYIMSFSDRIKILRRQELDAFIVTAFAPELMNAQYLQDLQLQLVTSRGVQLASLFMAGVETALMANDACGAPIPWLMCCPWLYFDGKLFHHILARASVAKNLLELCGGHIDRVVKVEKMRKAILEGINVIYARTPLPLTPGVRVQAPQNMIPAGCSVNELSRGRGVGAVPQRGMMRRPVPSRGGQLEIAGVVVGQWGPNYGQPGRLPQPMQGPRGRMPPQVTSIGGLKYGIARGFPPVNHPTFPNRMPVSGRGGKKTQMKATGKKKTTMTLDKEFEKKVCAGRGLSVKGVTDGFSNDFASLSLEKEETVSIAGKFDDAIGNGSILEQNDTSFGNSLPYKH